MLKGKLIDVDVRFIAQTGSVQIDVTEDVEELLRRHAAAYERRITALRSSLAELAQKWAKVVELVGPTGPTG